MDRELLEAACQGSLFRVNELIKQGADVNSGMCGAAEGGHKELVDLFIKNGANNWNFGMFGAAEGGHKELVDLFVKKGANDWNHGMCCAAEGGHKDLIELFIEHGANDWNWGMRGAAQGGHKELVDLFIKKGANDWNWGMCGAAEGGNKELIEFFIEHGAMDWNRGLLLSKTISRKIFFIDQGADDIEHFPLFYKDICFNFHLPNGVLINKLLRRYIARFKGNKLRNEKVIINDKHETTLDQVFISPPDTIIKFRDVVYQVKGFVFYVIKKRNPQFK